MSIVNDLRDAADWIEQHPGVETPGMTVDISGYAWSAPEFVTVARAAGRIDKDYSSSCAVLEKKFGCARFRVITERDKVCRAVVTGKMILPATPEHVIPARPAVEQDIIEWQCEPLLAKG